LIVDSSSLAREARTAVSMRVIATRTNHFPTLAVVGRCRHGIFDGYPMDLVKILMDE
jgi:hypothetical protein